MSNFRGAKSLVGGGFGALDAIDGADLVDDDGAVVITDILVYYYHLNATSGEEESPPEIIAPDTNPGDKRWILVDIYNSIDTFLELTDTPVNYTGEAGKYAKVNAGEDALEFDTPSATASFSSRCRVGLTSDQSIPSGAFTKLDLNDVNYDNDSEWDTTNKRFVAKKEGYYSIKVNVYCASLAATKTLLGVIYKNGAVYSYSDYDKQGAIEWSKGCAFSDDVFLEVDDFIEIFTHHTHGVNTSFIHGNNTRNFVAIHRFA